LSSCLDLPSSFSVLTVSDLFVFLSHNGLSCLDVSEQDTSDASAAIAAEARAARGSSNSDLVGTLALSCGGISLVDDSSDALPVSFPIDMSSQTICDKRVNRESSRCDTLEI
jgi:hypothetical protein